MNGLDLAREAGKALATWRAVISVIGVGFAVVVAPACDADATGAANIYAVGPVAQWVERHVAPVATPALRDQSSDGEAYLLFDSQVTSDARSRSMYRHIATEALTEPGVESAADIQIPFDPSYERLTVHAVQVRRAGHFEDRLGSARIRVLEREDDLDARIYDGTRTLDLQLEDVQVGDVVDYEYTISGRNPVFGARDFGSFQLEFSRPVMRRFAQLRLPATADAPAIDGRNGAPPPRVQMIDGYRFYRWDVGPTPPRTIDDGAPDWYFPFAEVRWTQFHGWAEVVQWALPLYRVPVPSDAAIVRVADRLRHESASDSDRLMAALRFVQTEIRYLGVEIGVNSHAPSPPGKVLQRRFGDCKDKTLLLLALLEQLGIEAHPALVNTSERQALADADPNPGAFDHVLVLARLDGRDYWLDPTRAAQRTPLDQTIQADYGLALPVSQGSRALVSMHSAVGPTSERVVRVQFDASQGFQKPIKLRVDTTATGQEADSLRQYLRQHNAADVQSSYLNYYTPSYPGLKVADPLRYDDDPVANRVVTHESYVLAHAVETDEKLRRHTVTISVTDVSDWLADPVRKVRSSPLAHDFPRSVRQVTEVLLPEVWPVDESPVEVSDEAFSFRQTVLRSGKIVRIDDQYRSLADSVATRRLPEYLAHLKRARDSAGFQFYWTDDTALGAGGGANRLWARVNWPVAVLGAVFVVLFAWIARRLNRFDPEPVGILEADRHSNGLGGWLLLVGIGLLVRPFYYLSALVDVARATEPARWSLYTQVGADHYHPLWAPLLIYELTFEVALLVWTLLMLVLYFRRRSSFPSLMSAYLATGAIFVVLDRLLLLQIPQQQNAAALAGTLLKVLVGASIWIWYLQVSRRVRATFTQRLR